MDPVLQELVLGPFARSYPHAARALERLSPKGHYRVMSDIGFTPQALDALEAELRDASPKSQESILRRVQKKHVTLNAAAEVMDKAFAAYDKLFGIERACEVVPTVYLFADSADFAAFSRRLEVGDTEHRWATTCPTTVCSCSTSRARPSSASSRSRPSRPSCTRPSTSGCTSTCTTRRPGSTRGSRSISAPAP
ncbi:MAG: hypothetical protein R3F62_16665 [Planctomycetota bacterium]